MRGLGPRLLRRSGALGLRPGLLLTARAGLWIPGGAARPGWAARAGSAGPPSRAGAWPRAPAPRRQPSRSGRTRAPAPPWARRAGAVAGTGSTPPVTDSRRSSRSSRTRSDASSADADGSSARASVSSSSSRALVVPRISSRPACTTSAARESSAAPMRPACERIRSIWSGRVQRQQPARRARRAPRRGRPGRAAVPAGRRRSAADRCRCRRPARRRRTASRRPAPPGRRRRRRAAPRRSRRAGRPPGRG